MTQNFLTATDEQVWQPWSQCAGVPVATVVDGAPALCGRSAECQWPDERQHSEPTAAGSSVHQRCRTTKNYSSPGDRRWTPTSIFRHWQTVTNMTKCVVLWHSVLQCCWLGERKGIWWQHFWLFVTEWLAACCLQVRNTVIVTAGMLLWSWRARQPTQPLHCSWLFMAD